MGFDFPFYTMEGDGDVFVKHVARDKCIVVNSFIYCPSIRVVNWSGLTTSSEYDSAANNEAQPIPKARFDLERQQVINQLIHG